jgi:hypothetical protein
MKNPPIRLDRIRVQTARMMEIYALLQGELEKNAHLLSSVLERSQLDRAIDTIRTNMRQLLEALTLYQEQNPNSENEAQELEEILNAVLEWHMTNAEGE